MVSHTTTLDFGDTEFEADVLGTGSIRCPVDKCRSLFDKEKDLRIHMAHSHSLRSRIEVECPECGEMFTKQRKSQVTYCSPECGSKSIESDYDVKSCEVCGDEFKAIHRSRFCSRECYTEHHRRQHDGYERECPICGETYETTREEQKYCSRECYLNNSGKDRDYDV